MMLIGAINASIYLKNDNLWSKCMKITRIRRADPVEKNSQSFEEAKPLAGILALVWLLHECKLHQLILNFGESQCPNTAVLQLCVLCEHACAW